MAEVVIIGCGLSGIVAARELADKGVKVKIIEKRDHIGGNIYDYKTESGILVQKYGPHVFFTDNIEIKKYISKYQPVEDIYAECRTYIDNKPIPIPFNFASIDMIYDDDIAKKLKDKLVETYGKGAIVSVVDLIENDDPVVKNYGEYMYEKEYRKYTAKQWDRPIENIDPSIFLRVPVYISYKKTYLKKKYQFMPKYGFTKLAESMLAHSNIEVELGTNALADIILDNNNECIYYKDFSGPILYTGPIDELFGGVYGQLPYRSLEFTWKVISKQDAPPTALSAYPEADKYIRITDYTKFPVQEFGEKSLIAIEYPLEYRKDELCGNEPYYPTITDESKELYNLYREESYKFKNLYLSGRLADYKYYNMDEVIEKARIMSCNILNSR